MASVTNSRLEEVVDRFELSWNDLSRDQIPSFLSEAGLNGNATAAAELVRIDIQRRYATDLPVELLPYLSLLAQEGA